MDNGSCTCGRATLLSAAVACCFNSAAFANPTGPNVVHGSATFSPMGSTLQITNTPNTIINWQGFSIGAAEITRFNQQSAASAVLNRVITQNPSSILGSLQSNGRVFLINPSGIVFGAGSRIDVAGLVASTLNLSNADFLSGRMRFSATPAAREVVNNGTITTTGAGAPIYLIGPAVTNGGIITSPRGEVLLAAGNSVEVMDPGTPGISVQITAPDNEVLNLGSIFADSGRVNIFAGLVRVSGVVQANTLVAGEDGRIVLKAAGDVQITGASVFARPLPGGEAGGVIDIQGQNIGMMGAWLASREQSLRAAGDISVRGSLVEANLQSLSASNISVEGFGPDPGAIVARIPGQADLTGTQNITINNGGTLALRAEGYDGSAGIHAGAQQIHFTSGGQLIINGSEALPIPFDPTFTLMPAFARIEAAESQVITGSPSITVNGNGGGARIITPGVQTIQAGNLTLIGNAAQVLARSQTIDVQGDLLLEGGSGGNDSSISSTGAGPSHLPDSAERLQLTVTGDVTLAGGSAPGSGAVIASNNGPISIAVGRTLTLQPGSTPGTLTGITSSTGDITISAGGNIALHSFGTDAADTPRITIIQTLGDVALSGKAITEGTQAKILGNRLNIAARGAVDLPGLNSVASFGGTASGNVMFINESPLLTVPGLQVSRNHLLMLTQRGNLLISGDVSSGHQVIQADGILITPTGPGGITVHAAGRQILDAHSITIQGGSASDAFARVSSTRSTQLHAVGTITIQGGSGSNAFALVSSARDIEITAENLLAINGGNSPGAWARVQTDRRASGIGLVFPRRSDGGWSVNGVAGAITDGGSGFFLGDGAAVLGHSLDVTYGAGFDSP